MAFLRLIPRKSIPWNVVNLARIWIPGNVNCAVGWAAVGCYSHRVEKPSIIEVIQRSEAGEWVAEISEFPDFRVATETYETFHLAINAGLVAYFSEHPELGTAPQRTASGNDWMFKPDYVSADLRLATAELRHFKRRMDRAGQTDAAYHFWFDDED